MVVCLEGDDVVEQVEKKRKKKNGGAVTDGMRNTAMKRSGWLKGEHKG